MTRKDAVLLASRAIGLYLVIWGVLELTYLPQIVLLLRRHSGTALVPHDSWWNYYRTEATFYIFRTVALLATATWLLKGGEKVEKFLLRNGKAMLPEATSPDHNAD